jgi:thioredoxin 1
MDVGKENFKQEVLESKIPVLVDFWAPWCGPCRAIAPLLEKIANERKGRVKVVKVNTDENPDLASKYGVMSIPNLIFFKDGKEIDRVVGFNPGKVEEMIKKEV